jgi:AcrR family transcriptional regulator
MTKSLKRQLTRQLILDKGLELFLQKGYQATSLDDILSSLKLTKGAFYYHFNSKVAFMNAIIEEIVSKKVYSQLIIPLEKQGDTLNLIQDTFEKSLVKLTPVEKKHGFMLSNFITEFSTSNEELSQKLKHIMDEWQLGLVKCLQRGKTSNYVSRHTDSEAVATYLISSYIGLRTLKKCYEDDTLRYKYLTQLKNYLNSLR